MNSDDGSPHIDRYSYGIGVTVGVILIILVITLLSHSCTRTASPANPPSLRSNSLRIIITQPDDHSLVTGLDDATLRSFPTLLYAHAKLRKVANSTASCCCSICLTDYKDRDLLRLLPDCGHLFHLKCIDPWLRLNPTCPMCRSSPLPTPLATPLAEVAPLAAAHS